MTLEARGLDVTPRMIDRLTGAGDKCSAMTLAFIHNRIFHHPPPSTPAPHPRNAGA
jgi:uncharacterized ferritin-like protein (DUF455 family)